MKKFLKRTLTLLALCIIGIVAWAQDATFTYSITGENLYLHTATVNKIETSFFPYNGPANTYSDTCPISFKCSSAKITKVVLYGYSMYNTYVYGTSQKLQLSTDGSTSTWEGSANEISFADSGDAYIQSAEVWIESTGGEVTPDPVVKPNFPVEGTAYQIKENNRGMFLNLQESTTYGTILGATQEALYFTWVEAQGAFTITNEAGLYVGGSTNTWNMSSSTVEYWTVEGTEGAYKLKCKSSKYIGFNDNVQINAFRDKDGSLFSIEPYQAPSVDPVDPGTGGGDGTATFDMNGKADGTYTSGDITLVAGGWNINPRFSGSLSYGTGSTLKFSAPTGSEISKIIVYNGFESAPFSSNSFSASPTGTVTASSLSYIWEGRSDEVTLTTADDAGLIVSRITVEYAAAAEPTRYQYVVNFTGYPDGTTPDLLYTNTNGSVRLHHGESALSFGKYITEDDIEVTPIAGYDYDVAITHPQGETFGRINVTFTEKVRYQYYIQFVGAPEGSDPTLVYTNENGSTTLHNGYSALSFGKFVSENDIEVTPIPGYTYEVVITDPAEGSTSGRITVTFTERPVNYFTIPTEAFRKDIDVTYDNDWNEVPISMYFRVLASDVPGLDSFKRNDNGKQITAQLSADGAESRPAYLTIYGGYDGSQASVKSFDLALADKAFCVTFPKGAFEAANGDLSDEFTYCYDPAANRVTYTFHFYNSNADAEVPADLAVVYANAPEGDQYTNGSNYVALYTPSASDFTSLNPYWEIDLNRSNVNGTNINLYFTQQSYKYYVTIEGNDNAGVKVNGVRYANGETVETYELLRRTDVTFLTYKGYNLITANLQDPEDGKGGVIYAKYEVKEADYASVDRTDPATGDYELNDHLDGLSSVNVYLDGDDFTQFGYYASDGNMPEGINVTDAQGNVTNYTVSGIMSWNGYSFCIVNLATPIKEAGIYTINIPAGVLPLADEEKTSPEMHLTYDVKAATMFDFGRQAAQPFGQTKDGGGLRTLEGFKVTIPSDVEIYASDLVGAIIYATSYDSDDNLVQGDPVPAGFVLNADDNSISITFVETFAPKTSEYYNFVVPQGCISSQGGRTNKKLELYASIDPTEYFDLVVTYPAEGNAAAPVDHITVQLPEGFQVQSVDDSSIYFNDHNATVEKFEQNGRELTITFADNAAEVGDYASYYIPSGAIVGTDITAPAAVVPMANSTAQQYNIPVTAAPVEYLVEFAGLEGVALPAAPAVTYNGQNYNVQQHILAADLTVEQLQATDISGYEYTITIDQPGYDTSHKFGRILVTYSKALNLAAVDLSMYVAADSKEGVSSAVGNPTTAGANIWNTEDSNYGLIKLNSPRPIRKVEIYVNKNASSVEERGQQGDFTVAGNIATWTGNSNALVFAATDDIYVTKLVAYYDADAEIPVDNSVALAKTVGGSVDNINRYVNLDFDANFAGTHSAYNGQTDIPADVKFCRINSDGSEEEITISEFNYWAGGPALSVVLENSIYTPGAYRLTIPAGTLEFAGGKGNSAIEVNWTISHFGLDEVAVIGNEADGSATFTEINGLEVTPAEGIVITGLTAGAAPVVNYTCGEDEGTLAIESFEALDDGSAQIFFRESITVDGSYTFSIPEGLLSMEGGYTNAAYGRGISATIDTKAHFVIDNVYSTRHYDFVNNFSTYYITAEDPDISDMLEEVENPFEYITAPFEVSYFDEDNVRHVETVTVTGAIIDKHNWLLSFDPVTVPFNTEYTLTFPAGFITKDNYVSSPSYIDGNQIWKHYPYSVHYEGFTAEEGVKYLCYLPTTSWCEDGADLNAVDMYGEITAEQLSAKSIDNMMPVFTIEHPYVDADGQVVKGTITLSYETIEPVLWDGEFTVNGTPSNLGKDWLCSITSFTLPAPEGHTFASAEDCAMLFKGNLDTEYEPYEVTATISEDGSEVTITLSPAYSTPSFGNDIALADGSLILDNGAPYDGFNYSFTLFPEYAFNIDHTDPADSGAAIYNGELNAIDVYLPAGVYPYTNGDLGIEVTGKGYVESFSCTGISNWGDFHRIQLPAGMSLPTGRVVMTIPAGMFYYTSNEDGQTYQNAPYTLWLDNYSALQLVAEPAAGTVVGLDAIRVKGERGTLWTADTDAEALAQHITFGTWEGPVAVTTAIENGVLVVTPVETLAEGNYTLTIDGLAGFLESADVAASVNAPARFEFNVVGSTFAFQGAQPYDGQIISDIHELETINLRFSTWTVGNVSVSEAAGNEPILVTLIDGEGIERTVIKTYPAVGEDEWGTPVAQLIGKMQGFSSFETADGKYNVSLTIPAGMFISDNGRTNEAMTLHYIYDSNKYFAVEPNFEAWGTLTGPVKTFTLTAAEGVTFTGIAPDKVDDPENGVDRPTVFNNSGYVTYAIPTISADGKSVTLALAEPLKNAEQYYLVVPEGLFIGTVTDENNRPATAINRGIGAWQQVFYVDAPVYEYAIINGGTTEYQSGDVLDESAVYSVFFPIAQGVDSGDASGVTLTDAEGNNIEISGAWRLWYEAHGAGINVQFNGSLTEEGTYHVHIPAGSFKDDNGADIAAIDFEFVISKFYNVYATDEDKTFTVLEYIDVDSQALYEDNYAIDVTKLCINTHEFDSNWQFIYAPVAVRDYEVVTVDPGVPAVRFYLETPIIVANSYEFKFKAGLFYGAGFKTREMKATLTVDPYPNDISRDGNEDLDDVDAIADIILRNEGWNENNYGKADLNDDGQVTIGDLVKYIEYLKTQSAEDNDTPIDEEVDEEL